MASPYTMTLHLLPAETSHPTSSVFPSFQTPTPNMTLLLDYSCFVLFIFFITPSFVIIILLFQHCAGLVTQKKRGLRAMHASSTATDVQVIDQPSKLRTPKSCWDLHSRLKGTSPCGSVLSTLATDNPGLCQAGSPVALCPLTWLQNPHIQL